MSDKKQMTISKELYKKYRDIQEKCYIELKVLGEQYERNVKLLENAKNKDDIWLIKEQTGVLTGRITVYQTKSEVLREILHEIAMENKEMIKSE